MIYIFISNDIQIRGLSTQLQTHICKALTLDNPMYHKLVQMAKRDENKRRALYACPETFKYYKVNGNVLHIPRGMRERLIRFLYAVKEPYEIKEDLVSKPARVAWNRSIELRPWQADACVAMEGKREGIVISGTGGGKTICMLEQAYRLGLTCTILTSKTSMVKQWADELKKFYGVEAGTIDGKSKEIKDFTVSTFQSLLRPTQVVMDLVENTSVLIIDEVQEVPADGKRKVVSRFKPTYIFGTTATMKREDGQGEASHFYIGDTLYEHHETQETPTVEIHNTGVKIDMDEYHAMIESMVENESRNNLIGGIILMEALAGRKVLVLTKRIAHAELLYNKFADWGTTYLISSQNKDKDTLLGEFKRHEREYSIIFGTTSLLSVGVDISDLETVVLACDIKAETLLVQSVGRALRSFFGKGEPKIIDFNDGEVWNPETGKKIELNRILLRQFQARMKIYRAKGWEVKFN